MDKWDQAKLEEVVKSKENRSNETKIVSVSYPAAVSCSLEPFLQICKYFLEALETKKYGWCVALGVRPSSSLRGSMHCCVVRRWVCPNGNDECQYKHRLPPGYVLKSEAKVQDQDEEEITIEEKIEEEVRLTLPLSLAPLHCSCD